VFGAHEPGEAAVLGQQLAGHLQGVIAPGAGAQHDRQQFRRRESLGAEVPQALPRVLPAGELAHGGVVFQLDVPDSAVVGLEWGHSAVFLLRLRSGFSPAYSESHEEKRKCGLFGYGCVLRK